MMKMELFTTLSVAVTEEIKAKKLATFIQTQIQLHNILLTKESYYFYTFIPEILRYEIVVFKSKKDIEQSGIFALSLLVEKNYYTLFILENYFVLYNNKKPFILKYVSHRSQDDIVSYLQQSYQITPSKIYHINLKELKDLQKKYKQNSPLEDQKFLHQIDSKDTYRYFLLYLISMIIIFAFIIYYKITSFDKIHSTTIFPTKQYSKEFFQFQKHLKKNTIQVLLELSKYIKNDPITIQNIKYSNNQFVITLQSFKKQYLLKLLDYPKKKIQLQSILFQKTNKIYLMEIILYE